MNTKNKRYKIRFSHYLTNESQSVYQQQAWNPELADIAGLLKFPKKDQAPRRV